MATAVMDQAPTMTLTEAEAAIQEWNGKLQQAQAALASHEQQIGQLALTGGTANAAQELTRLQVEVKIAEQALQAAMAQAEPARRRGQSERVQQLRDQATDMMRRAEEAAGAYNELAPQAARARQQMEDFARRATAMERQADELEYRLQQAVQS